MELCFDREFEFGVFMMGKRLKIACFAVWVFSYYQCIPTFLEKNGATSSPEFRTHLFTTRLKAATRTPAIKKVGYVFSGELGRFLTHCTSDGGSCPSSAHLLQPCSFCPAESGSSPPKL